MLGMIYTGGGKTGGSEALETFKGRKCDIYVQYYLCSDDGSHISRQRRIVAILKIPCCRFLNPFLGGLPRAVGRTCLTCQSAVSLKRCNASGNVPLGHRRASATFTCPFTSSRYLVINTDSLFELDYITRLDLCAFHNPPATPSSLSQSHPKTFRQYKTRSDTVQATRPQSCSNQLHNIDLTSTAWLRARLASLARRPSPPRPLAEMTLRLS